jgi:outer membrane receptor for ferrienterochelin and colicins
VKRTLTLLIFFFFISIALKAQKVFSGKVYDASTQKPLAGVSVFHPSTGKGTVTDSLGFFYINGSDSKIRLSAIGYKTSNTDLKNNEFVEINLKPDVTQFEELVVSGTLKEMSKMESPVAVDVLSRQFLYKNPTPSLLDAFQNVNGVRPQVNCNVCSTGDIHINGLEGAYTMVLIDGMPIVSSLGTVYGLSGIPNSLIEKIEIVKGPASTLYGSEALGGLINIITKSPLKAPKLSIDGFMSGWGEVSADLGYKYKKNKINGLLGLNAFVYNNPIDNNGDGFTDLTLQNRISLFNKWTLTRNDAKESSVAFRAFYEDRWGGQTQWKPIYRGGDTIYGESIFTKRLELIGVYQLPIKEKINIRYSLNHHHQNSVYGNTFYLANQNIAFAQATYEKNIKNHDAMIGVPLRYTYYDDNTPATTKNDLNAPQRIFLPGLFIQDEWQISAKKKLLTGLRYDFNSDHGSIITPRIAYKWSSNLNAFRVNAGRGFRVVNLFTEDHAALTGAREVIIKEKLKPEQSWNTNLNFVHKIVTKNGFIGLDFTAFYTFFNNQILPDYSTNPNQIIYGNLNGYSVSKGISLNTDFAFDSGLKILLGGTLMDVSKTEEGIKSRQILTERASATWTISYPFPKLNLNLDYTGNLSGPMLLPLLGPLDPRPEKSPTWSIQNIQLTKTFKNGLEFYGGVKNILNFNPAKGLPFLIARAQDPFDKNVLFDASGQILSTPENPNALSFDPTYVYASQQGRRTFFGMRWEFK